MINVPGQQPAHLSPLRQGLLVNGVLGCVVKIAGGVGPVAIGWRRGHPDDIYDFTHASGEPVQARCLP